MHPEHKLEDVSQTPPRKQQRVKHFCSSFSPFFFFLLSSPGKSGGFSLFFLFVLIVEEKPPDYILRWEGQKVLLSFSSFPPFPLLKNVKLVNFVILLFYPTSARLLTKSGG